MEKRQITNSLYGKSNELHRAEQRALSERPVRSAAHPLDQRTVGAQARHGALRRTSGRTPREGGSRPCGSAAHGGQSGGICREDRRSEGAHGARIRSLRRHARRSARGVAHRAFRARGGRRPHLGPRRRRRQGAALHACGGVRGDVRHRIAALQREVHARRRGGDRFVESLRLLPQAQADAKGRHHPGVRHLDDLDADPLDHVRPARPGLHGGRGYGTRQGPALGTLRRCGGQSGQRAGAPRGGADRRERPRDDPRVLRRRARADSRRAQGVQQGAFQPGRI